MTVAFFLNYLGFIVVGFFFFMPDVYRITYKTALKRNPAWVKQDPERLGIVGPRRLSIGISYVLGCVLAAVLTAAAFLDGAIGLMTPILVAAAFVLTGMSLVEASYSARVLKRIPRPSTRVVDLSRRDPTEHVPAPLIVAAYALLVAVLAVYAYGYSNELVTGEIATRRIIGISGIIFLSGVCYVLMFRRPAFMNALANPAQPSRRMMAFESYTFVAVLYLGVIVGVWRISNDFFGALAFNDHYAFFTLSLIYQAGCVYILSREELVRIRNETAEEILRG